MSPFQTLILIAYFLQILGPAAANCDSKPSCKATPGSRTWPSKRDWQSLNRTLSGQLLNPSPPGAVCHPDQPTFDAAACPAVQQGWLTSAFHADDPVSSLQNNWNNDTCLPYPTDPCSGQGYPIYVVNATCAGDVKKGVDFARENNVRLIVKGTGHDYLGRSSAPNALSIWTHNIRGLTFHDSFTPKGCQSSIDTPAVTAAAGTEMLELYYQAQQRNLAIVGGGAGTVGVGGYLTGGGHSYLSTAYGMAADQVLEIEMVTPGGDILTVNECQHQDLFWAMRGGGGSTFGVLTSVTIKAFHSSEFATTTVLLASELADEDAYWNVITNILSKFPELSDQGVSGYTNIIPNFTMAELNITTPINVFAGLLCQPLISSSNTSDSFAATINNFVNDVTTAYTSQVSTSVSFTTYPNLWAYYENGNGPLDAGDDVMLGSRLLDGEALSGNRTALKQAIIQATPPNSMTQANLVAGKNVWNAQPRGGSDAINPAWRKAYVHAIMVSDWQALDTAEEENQVNSLNSTRIQALRDLAPNMGAYVNEAYPYEPDFQQTFWGDNYPRLLKIKRAVDPWDVFWCQPCVGNERWHVVDDVLCKL